MTEMTTHERTARMYAHKDADRVPIYEQPWTTAKERWHKEGMPRTTDFVDYFKLDRFLRMETDNSPRYPEKIVEQTDEYIIKTTSWGVTLRNWKHMTSVPEFIDFTIKNPDDWKKARERMVPTKDRIPWDLWKTNYKKWRDGGAWIEAELWFGFDVTHSWTIGTENLLMALLDEPEWCSDMFNHFLTVHLALWDQVWDAGYKFDGIFWPDDMGFKQAQFMSLDTYRAILKPVHKRAIDWAHAKGIKARLHSCGEIQPFIPDLLEIGLDGLNPLEVKAGVDPAGIKKKFGKKLLLHGGVDALLWDHPEKFEAEIRRIVPVLKKDGGYIFSTDHSVPDSVSLKDFGHMVNVIKQVGTY